jgi:enamine deaminase RidA (YjgF/YER057c/UK114 family)
MLTSNVSKFHQFTNNIKSSAPAALGPYSQGVSVNGVLYVSGQLGLDPVTSNLVQGGVVPQARQAFKNIREILIQANSDFQVYSSRLVLMLLYSLTMTIYYDFYLFLR